MVIVNRILDISDEVAQVAREAEAKFHPDVVRIRFSIGYDWAGDPAIFFRVVLSDEASQPDRLGDVVRHVSRTMFDDPKLTQYDAFRYFDFRSNAEQEALKDPRWE